MYKSLSGVVQFDPRESTVNGKAIRNLTIQEFGIDGQRFSATLWPTHKHVKVEKGDIVSCEGTYTKNDKGETTYHNLSVMRFKNHGPLDAGKDESSSVVDDEDDDSIPF